MSLHAYDDPENARLRAENLQYRAELMESWRKHRRFYKARRVPTDSRETIEDPKLAEAYARFIKKDDEELEREAKRTALLTDEEDYLREEAEIARRRAEGIVDPDDAEDWELKFYQLFDLVPESRFARRQYETIKFRKLKKDPRKAAGVLLVLAVTSTLVQFLLKKWK
jgi:hypothetical protein